ncbi:MAG: helix-turn-helix domain-containing protein [Treponema sp.]|nr:helix-turn-helix domain-containing protein [Treponema sp.]
MEKLQIGDMIRVLRRNKEITQEQLAEILDVSTPAICKWESGQTNPDITLLPVIARYFKVSIDFLLGFSTELSLEKIKGICDDISQKFIEMPFAEAQKEWRECLKQFPACFPLRFELANIAMLNLAKAETQEEVFNFTIKLIDVYEECTGSDELRIKQGSYFQIANLYISLQDFDKAVSVINQMPAQVVNPKTLLSMIYVHKKEYKSAIKNIQENIFYSMNNIFGELGNMINVYRITENEDLDKIQKLFHQIINIFELEPLYGVSVYLLAAQMLAEKQELKKVKIELQKVVEILEKYPHGSITINKTPFFNNLDYSILEKSGSNFSAEVYRMLLNNIFELSKKDKEIIMLKSRIEKAL